MARQAGAATAANSFGERASCVLEFAGDAGERTHARVHRLEHAGAERKAVEIGERAQLIHRFHRGIDGARNLSCDAFQFAEHVGIEAKVAKMLSYRIVDMQNRGQLPNHERRWPSCSRRS